MYLVDTNFFIQAHRAIYPIGVFTSFWAKVKELAEAGKIISLDKVKNELYIHEDQIKNWCASNLPDDFFKDSTIAIDEYQAIAKWANSMAHHYRSTAISGFLAPNLADPWLVAYALKEGLSIVTYEKSEPQGKKRIKIPEVCNQFGVNYLNTVEMLVELGESF